MSTQTQSHPVLKFLGDVAEQRLGYRFGEPERVTPDSLSVVIPILRDTPLARQYVLLSEVADEVEITDTGRINRMKLKNNSKKNVFVRSGTIFRGGTQERTLTRSAVLFPGMEVELDVRCVHQTKGIRGGTKVTAAGFTPLDVDKGVYGAGFTPKDQSSYWNNVAAYSAQTRDIRGEKTVPAGDKSKSVKLSPEQLARLRGGRQLRNLRVVSDPVRDDVPVAGEQPKAGEVWGGVRQDAQPRMMVDPNSFQPDSGESCHDLRAHFGDPTILRSANTGDDLFDTAAAAAAVQQGHQVKQDDLASTIDSVASNLDAILSKVKRVDQQVGIGLVTEKGLQCIELFDLDASWEAIHKDVVTRVGSDLAKKDQENVFEYKPQAALNTMAAVLADGYKVNSIFEHKPSNGEPLVKIFGLTSDRFVGEVVELDNRVVHVSIIRTAA